jgi:hypothetical protein
MSETVVVFDGFTLDILERSEINVDFEFQETLILSGKTAIDALTETKFSRTYKCYTASFSDITTLLGKIGQPKTLIIDSTSYTNCYISPPFSYKEIVFGSGKYTYNITFKRDTT